MIDRADCWIASEWISFWFRLVEIAVRVGHAYLKTTGEQWLVVLSTL